MTPRAASSAVVGGAARGRATSSARRGRARRDDRLRSRLTRRAASSSVRASASWRVAPTLRSERVRPKLRAAPALVRTRWSRSAGSYARSRHEPPIRSSPAEWWLAPVGRPSVVAARARAAGRGHRHRRRPDASGVRRDGQHGRAQHAATRRQPRATSTAPRSPRSSARRRTASAWSASIRRRSCELRRRPVRRAHARRADRRGSTPPRRPGRVVINLSFGCDRVRRALLENAIDYAVPPRGRSIVAAAGERAATTATRRLSRRPAARADGRRPPTEHGRRADFSSRLAGVDLAAPGVDIPAAVPRAFDPSGYAALDGTSFSAPIVSGAAAWVWTARPRPRRTRRSSTSCAGPPRDSAAAGFDADTGFGMLDIPAALALAGADPRPAGAERRRRLVSRRALRRGTQPLDDARKARGARRGPCSTSGGPDRRLPRVVPAGRTGRMLTSPRTASRAGASGGRRRHRSARGARRRRRATCRERAGRVDGRTRRRPRSAVGLLPRATLPAAHAARTAYSLSVDGASTPKPYAAVHSTRPA